MFVVSGGVGDFLQSLPFIIHNKKESYVISSHFKQCEDFFNKFNVFPKLIITYDDFDGWVEANRCIDSLNVINTPRASFFDENPFPEKRKIFDDKPVIGLHLGYSKWSVSNDLVHGYIPKRLTPDIFEIIPKDYNVLVFVSADEYEEFSSKHPETDSFKYVNEKDITNSLSYVSQCDAFIGSDSVYKTMSSMLNIPTIVLHGDYFDNQRDINFINPYVDAGCMIVYRYKNFISELDNIKSFIHSNLELY